VENIDIAWTLGAFTIGFILGGWILEKKIYTQGFRDGEESGWKQAQNRWQ
jgi:hypothetical protein